MGNGGFNIDWFSCFAVDSTGSCHKLSSHCRSLQCPDMNEAAFRGIRPPAYNFANGKRDRLLQQEQWCQIVRALQICRGGTIPLRKPLRSHPPPGGGLGERSFSIGVAGRDGHSGNIIPHIPFVSELLSGPQERCVLSGVKQPEIGHGVFGTP